MGKILGSGAEAVVMLDSGNVSKDRLKKGYRHEAIDAALRSSRTKREVKILKALESEGFVPKVLDVKENIIVMELINGEQLKKSLDKNPKFASLIGKNLAIMHEKNIIHGDLTTSNMMLSDETSKNKKTSKIKQKLYFIDFGLSYISTRVEDKAVDIHLFRQALESKHYKVFDKAYKEFLKGYNPKNKKEILSRLEIVESRGKYKEKF